MAYSPWVRKGPEMTERLTLSLLKVPKAQALLQCTSGSDKQRAIN